MIFMFHLICVGMLIFRAQSVGHIFDMLHAIMFDVRIGGEMVMMAFKAGFYIWILLAVQFAQYFKKDLMCVYNANVFVKAGFYTTCYFLAALQGVTYGNEFIYFQF